MITLIKIGGFSIGAQCFSEKDRSLTIANGAAFFYRRMIVLEPGETDTLLIFLSRPMNSLPVHIQKYFKGMFGLPGGFVRHKINLDFVNPFEGEGRKDFRIEETEPIKIAVLRKDNLGSESTRMILEYVTLE